MIRFYFWQAAHNRNGEFCIRPDLKVPGVDIIDEDCEFCKSQMVALKVFDFFESS